MSKSDKIMGITFQKMKNEMHKVFMYDVKRMLADGNMPLQGFEKLIEAFNIAYAEEVAANGVRRKSYITDDMVKLNTQREELYAGLVYQHESALRHYDETKRIAAKGISYIMKSIAYMHNMSNVKRNVTIMKITYNLRLPKHEQTLETLQLMGWLDALDAVNELYQQTDLNRNAERSQRGNGNVLKARKVTDKAYQVIVNRIHALITLNGAEEYSHFVRLLNVYIAQEKRSMAISAGWRKHNKEKAKKESSEKKIE